MVMLRIISSNLKIWIDMVENCAFLLSIILSHSHFVLFLGRFDIRWNKALEEMGRCGTSPQYTCTQCRNTEANRVAVENKFRELWRGSSFERWLSCC